MAKVLCDICQAPMTFICRLHTKKSYIMRRYQCTIDPSHQRTIVTNDTEEVNRFMRLASLDLAKKFKQEVINREP
jgi:hypothetical protein